VSRISTENVGEVLVKVKAINYAQQLALADEIYHKQSHLLASCLVLSTLGAGMTVWSS